MMNVLMRILSELREIRKLLQVMVDDKMYPQVVVKPYSPICPLCNEITCDVDCRNPEGRPQEQPPLDRRET